MNELRVLIEAKQPADSERRSAWFTLPIDEEELEEALGIEADSDDYRIIEKDVPFADDVGEDTAVERLNDLYSMYEDLPSELQDEYGELMLGLHSEFLPASKRYINDYVQYVKSDFLAGLGFGATQQLGENTGIYIGYSVDTGRNVYLQPSLASQGIKGTVTKVFITAF